MWRGFPDRLTKEPLEDLMPPGEGPVVILINQLLVQYLYQNPVYHKRIHNEWKIDRLAEDPGAVQVMMLSTFNMATRSLTAHRDLHCLSVESMGRFIQVFLYNL